MHSIPKLIFREHSQQGRIGYLLGAIEYASSRIDSSSSPDNQIIVKDQTGDIQTAKDRIVQQSFQTFYSENDIPIIILSEEGNSYSKNPIYVKLLDPIDGSINSENDLPYGTNTALADYKPQLRVEDFAWAVVYDHKNGIFHVGSKNEGAYRIVKGEKQNYPESGKNSIVEIASPFSYTTENEQRERQKKLTEIFHENIGNQLRSQDVTGLGLVNTKRAFGDWRNVTKTFDVLPSGLILKERGYAFTDVLGFDFSKAIVYDENNSKYEATGGLNTKIGGNFIAANPKDHELLIFGERKPHNMRDSHPTCTWDIFMKKEVGFPSHLFSWRYELPIDERKEFRDFGIKSATKLKEIINERHQIYGGLNSRNVKYIITEIKNRYINSIAEKHFPNGDALHLEAFDQVIREIRI